MKRQKILVCDDVKPDREALMRGIAEIWPEASLKEASKGQEVLEELEKRSDYDFIFLDIYLEDMNGIDLGRKLRKSYPEIKLVFVSDSREFGPEAFELNAVHYLLKPFRRELLEELRDRFDNRDEAQVSVYDSTVRQKQKIPCRKISYIESAHNYVYIHFLSGAEMKVRISMQDLEAELDERFLRISRGIIVNMDAVECMNSDSCEIEGRIFLLSRTGRQECRKKYNEYIFHQYMEGEWGGGYERR